MATVKDLKDLKDPTITSGSVDSWSEYNMSDLNATWLSGGSGGGGYTYTTTGTGAGVVTSPWIATGTNASNTLSVKGDAEFDGDITVKGRSLAEFMESVEHRLNILRPNPDLEAEWDQLRALGEQYRELEQQLKEKSRMWDTLKK
jgi:hypothetical protein